MPILIILYISDLLLYAVIPVTIVFPNSSIQVNPRRCKCGVTSYYLIRHFNQSDIFWGSTSSIGSNVPIRPQKAYIPPVSEAAIFAEYLLLIQIVFILLVTLIYITIPLSNTKDGSRQEIRQPPCDVNYPQIQNSESSKYGSSRIPFLQS